MAWLPIMAACTEYSSRDHAKMLVTLNDQFQASILRYAIYGLIRKTCRVKIMKTNLLLSIFFNVKFIHLRFFLEREDWA